MYNLVENGQWPICTDKPSCCVACTQLGYIVRMSFGSNWKHAASSWHTATKYGCTKTEPNTKCWKQLLSQNVASVYGKTIFCAEIFVLCMYLQFTFVYFL